MCTWESARSILELGLRFFLPAVLLPSFLPSLPLSFPSSSRDYVLLSCWFSILLPFSFDRFVRGSRCKCSMQQVCQLLWGGEQPTALAAAWAEGMSAVASVEASYSVSYFITYVNIRPSPHFNPNLQTQGRRHIVIVFVVVIVRVLIIIIVIDIDKDIDIDAGIVIVIVIMIMMIMIMIMIMIIMIMMTMTMTMPASISISLSISMTMMMMRTLTMTTTKTMTMWRRPCVCRFGLKWGEGRMLTYVMK